MTKPITTRLLSLDLFRGLIMVLLALESAGLYEHLNELTAGSGANSIIQQFFHHPWNGLRFWDLIQPGFMFIAGTAMAYSLDKQFRSGATWGQAFRKVLRRSWWLFFWGVVNYAVQRDGTLRFMLWNVLTQLSFTTILAFLVFRWNYRNQVLFCVGLLLLTEILYRYTNIPGFNEPFTDQKNFGNYMDLVLMNIINPDGWVAINCIPTAVHTIAGMMAGQVLLRHQPLRWLVISGAISLILGFALDFSGVTPIIKRIATSSFTLSSLGYCLLALSFFYWLIDIRKTFNERQLKFFTIVGMNSLFIYLFFEIVGHRWFNGYVSSFTSALALADQVEGLFTALVIFGLEWGMCWFLYRKKIFFRL